jgi:hypothetical protein
MLQAHARGEDAAPYFDLNHDDKIRTFLPKRFEWGGDDPKAGGIRVLGDWTNAGARSATDGEVSCLSASWGMKREVAEATETRFWPQEKVFLGISHNCGGLVPRSAFHGVQAFAKATDEVAAHADAADGDPDECDIMSASAHQASAEAHRTGTSAAHNKAAAMHEAAAALHEKSGDEAAQKLHQNLAKAHRAKADPNSAGASASAADPNPQPNKTMTDQEIQDSIAKAFAGPALKTAIESAVKPLEDRITALAKANEDRDKNAVEAAAKAALQPHIARGAIAPQDNDAIAFWTNAYKADAKNTEAALAKLPGKNGLRIVLPAAGATATAAASGFAEDRIAANAKELNKDGKLAGAKATDAYLHSKQGDADYRQYRDDLISGNSRFATVTFNKN